MSLLPYLIALFYLKFMIHTVVFFIPTNKWLNSLKEDAVLESIFLLYVQAENKYLTQQVQLQVLFHLWNVSLTPHAKWLKTAAVVH